MHLEHGRDYLARGQLAEALNSYHAAVGEFRDRLCVCVCVWVDLTL